MPDTFAAAKALIKATDFFKFQIQVAKGVKRRAAAEAAKQYVNLVNGDLKADKKIRRFLMVSTPAGYGKDAAFFFDWQTVRPVGGQEWKFAQPKWRLYDSHQKKIWLDIQPVPEQDQTAFSIKMLWGNKQLYFRRKYKNSGTMELGAIPAQADALRLVDLCPNESTSRSGIDLSQYHLLGTRSHSGGRFQ